MSPPARGPGSLYRLWQSVRFLATRDRRAVVDFFSSPDLDFSLVERARLLARFETVTQAVRGYHTLSEMLALAREILARRRPVVVEAGCGYGASTAKLSVATALAGGTLIACDTFRGMPANEEQHEQLDGRPARFHEGAFRGSLTSVKRTVSRWGEPSVCRFEKGRLETTLPVLDVSPDVVVLDVDLLASTRTSLVHLWPKLRPDGVVISLDGQLKATHALLGDPSFWRIELGTEPPAVHGLGRDKLLTVEARARCRPT